MKILVTGATGNVGSSVLKQLSDSTAEVHAGVRNIKRASKQMGNQFTYRELDFEKKIYPTEQYDAVFLVRPPQLAQSGIFEGYLRTLNPDTKVVFLSVLGADTMSYLPHAKIEKIIRNLDLEHIFLRPAYFMENLVTTLWNGLQKHNAIYLPAGDLTFHWIAIDDIAQAAKTALLNDLKKHSYELCTASSHDFQYIVDTINKLCGTSVEYQSPYLLSYFLFCLKEQKSWSYIFVMLLLHYLPRYRESIDCSSEDLKELIGREPTSIETFIRENCDIFSQLKRSNRNLNHSTGS